MIMGFHDAGCLYPVCAPALAAEGKDESGKGKDRKHSCTGKYENGDREPYFRRHGCRCLNMPEVHVPPPCECRIWCPDRPAGQQPPSAECGRVPPGAFVISHPKGNPGYAYVTVWDPQRPGSIDVVREFNIRSNTFVGIVLDR